ncbi:MAG: alpha-L-glutamate ligase-like protein [Pseudomonadota bacterium]|nr:alpha-L-glutamate ligase-like protein [Pseudomonadota bacterium]
MFGIRSLQKQGVLGMNRRNADYISRYNPRHLYPLVDDKTRTKTLALEVGIQVPELFGVIEVEHQLRSLGDIVARHDAFVVKPANGSGGNGILVIDGRMNGQFRKLNGQFLHLDEIAHHISNILSGMYSLGGQPDKALIEYRVEFDPLFEKVSYQGVPDIRIIAFQGVPVMAMARLPTRQSGGRANLHQGAVGVGIDIAKGITTGGVWRNRAVSVHPDTGADIANIAIPRWDHLLELAARCYDLTGLGYLGVDVVLDRHLGALVLEMNARPGLSIQIANRAGLLHRLRQVEACAPSASDPLARAQLCVALFA